MGNNINSPSTTSSTMESPSHSHVVLASNSMIKDIYFHGKVLAKKFRLLRIAYTLFMIGMAVAVLSFVVALMLYPHGYTPE